jgi:hypothetical protein
MVRLMHEAKQHERNSFITLTYNDENLPFDGSLNKEHFQKFMKRLRKKIGKKIRFFHCGEYGEKFDRPHYHACIFGFDFPDKVTFKENNGNMLFTSELLDEVWGKGYCTVGNLTFESAAYVARYCTKVITGDMEQEHYQQANIYTGELYDVEKEYATMSNRPGIGKKHYEKYKEEIYSHDEVITKGVAVRPPRYYDILYSEENEKRMEEIKEKRVRRARKHAKDNTNKRLRVREKVKTAQFKMLKRSL